MVNNMSNRHSDETIPARPEINLSSTEVSHAPWLLRRHLDDEIDLDRELNSRFQAMPVLSTIKFQRLDAQHAAAVLTTQDGAAVVRVEVDLQENVVDFVFTLRSMLSLRFSLSELGNSHRAHWLERVRHDQGHPAFLWGPSRWDNDYLIAVSHQYFTNLYAFSSRHVEAAARLSSDVRDQLLDWLTIVWQPRSHSDETIASLTTW